MTANTDTTPVDFMCDGCALQHEYKKKRKSVRNAVRINRAYVHFTRAVAEPRASVNDVRAVLLW